MGRCKGWQSNKGRRPKKLTTPQQTDGFTVTKTILNPDDEKMNQKTIKIGTWNVKSLLGKEKELVNEFNSTNLKILAITETKKKGQGCIEVDDGHILIYRGVKKNQRPQAGVACLIAVDWKEKIMSWEPYSERILKIELQWKIGEEKLLNLIVVYAPNS